MARGALWSIIESMMDVDVVFSWVRVSINSFMSTVSGFGLSFGYGFSLAGKDQKKYVSR